MDAKTLRRKCEVRLRALPIPSPFDIPAFVEVVAAQRGRPIALFAWEMPDATVSGICLAEQSRDLIFYAADTTPTHQQQIILHELAHLLCGHEGMSGGELNAALFPDLAPGLFALRRQTYADEDEREAETLASLILERVQRTQANTPAYDQHTTDVLRFLDRLEGTALD